MKKKKNKEENKIEKRNIKQILIDIWSNIKILRFLTVIATLFSFILACNDLYFIIEDWKTNRLITRLENSSLELNNGGRDFCRNWIKDVELLKNNPKYRDTYYFLKGMGLAIVISKDPLFSTELPPIYYLRNITSESPHFSEAIIYRCLDIMENSADSLKNYKLYDLIVELEKLNYQTPRYYFVKYIYASHTEDLDTIVKYYNDLRTKYLDSPNYNNNEYIRDVIKSKDNKISDLNQVQTLEYLYNIEILKKIRLYKKFMDTFSQDYILQLKIGELICKDFLKQINQLPDNQLGFLRGGFNDFQISNPLFPPGLHLKLFYNNSEWFKYQRFYLDKFINLED